MLAGILHMINLKGAAILLTEWKWFSSTLAGTRIISLCVNYILSPISPFLHDPPPPLYRKYKYNEYTTLAHKVSRFAWSKFR